MEVILPDGYVLQTGERTYQILQLLGRGSASVAYLAVCQQDGLTTRCILKEYNPHHLAISREGNGDLSYANPVRDEFLCGKERFLRSGKRQNKIRQLSALNNQTPPVSHSFEAKQTAYIDVACYNGNTLDKLMELTLQQSMAICRTIAKMAGYYHKSGYLCLDLKPENIFILQNAPDDTITQLVEFIDFDSLREKSGGTANAMVSYTREWAAPEQMNPYSMGKIGEATDIYTIGEIVFFLLFDRHSTESEHRGFSKYPFDQCKKAYRSIIARLDIQSLFTKLFHNTIRSSATNRYQTADQLVNLLEQLLAKLNQKDYIIPILPAVSLHFVGRDTEMQHIAECLRQNRVLFLTGIGGIGKSTLVRNFINRHKIDYDVIVYLEFESNIQRTFSDDLQIQISTIHRAEQESVADYYLRKLKYFKTICEDKNVLLVIDNYSGKMTKELTRLINGGYDTILVSRQQPPKNSYATMTVEAIADSTALDKLITLNLERTMTKEERLCFDEIITQIEGHTLVLELIARQIAAKRIHIQTALKLIRENGFSKMSDQKIDNLKDGEEVYDTLSAIICALFDAGGLCEPYRVALKTLSLLEARGLESELLRDLVNTLDENVIQNLRQEGWISADHIVRVHSVIAETVRSWNWPNTVSDIHVMKLYKNMVDIYDGMGNHEHIYEIVKEAKAYAEVHSRHIIQAMYYDMLGNYLDTRLDGNYLPENEPEAELLQELIQTMSLAVENMELSSDSHREQYLIPYYLSLASIQMRSIPTYHSEAKKLLHQANDLIEKIEPAYSQNRCYFCMASAWYFTLVEPDLKQMKKYTNKAIDIAKKVFKTELEIIDIVYIPTANCYFYHNDLTTAAIQIDLAIQICKQHSDAIPYIDKQAELLNCLLDIHFELQNIEKCRTLISEIDAINKAYQNQGVSREVSREIREIIMK